MVEVGLQTTMPTRRSMVTIRLVRTLLVISQTIYEVAVTLCFFFFVFFHCSATDRVIEGGREGEEEERESYCRPAAGETPLSGVCFEVRFFFNAHLYILISIIIISFFFFFCLFILSACFVPTAYFFALIITPREEKDRFDHEDFVRSTFPQLNFKVYYDPEIVRNLISTSVRQALEQPLNYARNYLAGLIESCVKKVIYLDSDLIVVDDIRKLWTTNLGEWTIGAPEYCHANFSKYFTARFWSDERFSGTFVGRKPCYFNTGVMVIDLVKWRNGGYTEKIEWWMKLQKSNRIYELGSLPDTIGLLRREFDACISKLGLIDIYAPT